MASKWEDLLAQALKEPILPEDLEEQRRSFAYGNTHLENSHVTREMIDEEADKQAQRRGTGAIPSRLHSSSYDCH